MPNALQFSLPISRFRRILVRIRQVLRHAGRMHRRGVVRVRQRAIPAGLPQVARHVLLLARRDLRRGRQFCQLLRAEVQDGLLVQDLVFHEAPLRDVVDLLGVHEADGGVGRAGVGRRGGGDEVALGVGDHVG